MNLKFKNKKRKQIEFWIWVWILDFFCVLGLPPKSNTKTQLFFGWFEPLLIPHKSG
jgi:hypothetical protein